METVKAQMDEKTAKEMRAMAMQVYGHKKGAISNAITAAVKEWLLRLKTKKKKQKIVDWSTLRGALKGEKMTAVEMQHHITREIWPSRVD